jgi:predicted O-linked N-acetylglucosamine transferase (SPINDLY family)
MSREPAAGDGWAEAFDRALEHHRARRWQAAERAYRQILEAAPNQPDAVHGLGVLAYQRGEYETAITCFSRAVTLRPESGPFHSNFGLACLAVRQFDRAVALLSRAVGLCPRAADMHFNLGNAFRARKDLDEACACYRRAIDIEPAYAEAYNNLGNSLRDGGQLDPAEACLRRALEIQPNYAEAHNNLGNVLRDRGKAVEAEACCRTALELRPDFAEARNNLGNALKSQGRKEEAEACYRLALERAPGFFEAWENLGAVLLSGGKIEEAVRCYRRAVELRPDRAEGYCGLGNALMTRGDLDAGDAGYRRALELRPDYAEAHSAALLWRQYRPGVTLAALAADHAEWDRLYGQVPASTTTRAGPPPTPHRPLRLGFVSADFGQHPVGCFCIRAFESLAPGLFDICCYSNCFRDDALAVRFKTVARLWREIHHLTDAAVAEQILADGIDVLIDLAGHSAGNRLPVFARKPAPVQITWIGSEGTTGLSAMDYILADECVIPPGVEGYYCERVLRLPDVYVCFDPPREAAPVGPLPAPRRGHVTFGCFNNPAKLNAQVAAVWSQILRRVPGSRLVLKYRGLTDAGLRDRIFEMFEVQGVTAERLEFHDWSSRAAMLAEYNAIDLALDPFPFAGGATTCEALWMGVPVITCPGATFAGRHSLSYLTAVGLTTTIARDLQEYVEIAASQARDLDRLATARARMREQMAGSPLCDGSRFAANLAAMLYEVCSR